MLSIAPAAKTTSRALIERQRPFRLLAATEPSRPLRLQRELADSRPEPNLRAALALNVSAKQRRDISIDERRPFGEARHKSGVGACGAS